jgi:hypothetical protein
VSKWTVHDGSRLGGGSTIVRPARKAQVVYDGAGVMTHVGARRFRADDGAAIRLSSHGGPA